MPYKSRFQIDIPQCALPTFLLGNPTDPIDNEKKHFVDAHDPKRFFTKAQFRTWCKRFAVGLRKAGLKQGDRVLLFSSNDLFYPVAFLGIVMAGGIFTGANPTFVPRELAYQLKDSDALFLICNETVLGVGIEAAKLSGMDKDRVFVFNGEVYNGQGSSQKGCRNWSHLLAPAEESENYAWDDLQESGAGQRTLALNYSSGTTGLPKGVEITHQNYVSNTAQMCYISTLRPGYWDKLHIYRSLCFLPLYHAMAQAIFISNNLRNGVPVYIMRKFDFLQMLEYVQKYQITSLHLVPPIAVAMAKHPAVKNYDLSSILSVSSGAAPLGREIISEVQARFPSAQGINMKQGYGMTEVTCSCLTWDPARICENSSVGEPAPNCEIAVMPPSSHTLQKFDPTLELPRNTRGELWVRGPNVMKGYWRNPSATAITITQDRWLKTGDVCYIDDEGYVFVVDRLKELIKVKGNQVAPAELEAVLLDHAAIADVAVIGVKTNTDDSSAEELVRAYVVLQPDATEKITSDEIVQWMKERAARHKWLTGGVRFVPHIPKNPSGKILRKELREMERLEREKTRREEGARL